MKTRRELSNKGTFRISKFPGNCQHCGEGYVAGDKVNWNPRVKGTCCHAGCYEYYGSPKGAQYVPTPVGTTGVKVEPTVVRREVEEVEVKTATVSDSGLAETLAIAVKPYLDKRLDANNAELAKSLVDGGYMLKTVHTVEVFNQEKGTYTDMGIQHKDFPLLLQTLQAVTDDGYRLNVWLVGSAGTGKTTAAKKCAEALGVPYYFTGSIDTEYKLLGFVDAQGKVINTAFRKAYIHGGVFLFDECDSSLPAALLAFNAALANGECAFPDGVFPRHKDFICIAAANTWGLGATIEYVGRLKLDAAFLDRFVQIDWRLDESLELAICSNATWVKQVQTWRNRAKAKGLKVMISPRASVFGTSLLKTGMAQDMVEKLTVRKAMTEAQWESIQRD